MRLRWLIRSSARADIRGPQHRRHVVLIALGDADEHSLAGREVVIKSSVDLIDIERARNRLRSSCSRS